MLQAITIAGGFTDFARKSRVRLTRANKKIFYEDCKKALEHPDLDLEIFPGDVVYVPKRLW